MKSNVFILAALLIGTCRPMEVYQVAGLAESATHADIRTELLARAVAFQRMNIKNREQAMQFIDRIEEVFAVDEH